MSENAAATMDRRERKSRQALLRAFIRLVLSRRYEEIQVSDIAREADVGRSTFYAHYDGKDELLFDSMGWFFTALADAVGPDADQNRLRMLADHVWQNRAMGRRIMVGPKAPFATPAGVRRLADAVEARLEGLSLTWPARLLALQIAEAQLGLLRAWFSAEAAASPEDIAQALHRTGQGLLAAALVKQCSSPSDGVQTLDGSTP